MENKKYKGLYYTQFISSFADCGLNPRRGIFRTWLKQLEIEGEAIPDNVVDEIWTLARTGDTDLELEAFTFKYYNA